METNIRDILLHDFIKKYKDYDVQVVDENFPNYKILTYSFIFDRSFVPTVLQVRSCALVWLLQRLQIKLHLD